MAMTIRTNNVPRDTVDAWQLTMKERKEFDYINWAGVDDGRDSATFFRYRGQLYDLSQFSRIIPPGSQILHPMECSSPDLQGWDGYTSDSFFSGMVVRYPHDEFSKQPDPERIIVGAYSC